MIKFGYIKEVNDLVYRFHYSHRKIPEATIALAVSYHNKNKIQAGLLFCRPPSRWKEPVLELLRMVRCDNYDGIPMTSLVSVGLKKLRNINTYDLIVSFADSSQNHHGGVYQACSWNYNGLRKKRVDGFFIDGNFVPMRTCNHRYGTSSLPKLRELFSNENVEVVPHYDMGKHLYWKALNKQGLQKATRLGLVCNIYPKPDLK